MDDLEGLSDDSVQGDHAVEQVCFRKVPCVVPFVVVLSYQFLAWMDGAVCAHHHSLPSFSRL